MSNLVQKLTASGTPFAVIQYYEWARFDRDYNRNVYQLMYVKNKMISFHSLSYEEIQEAKKLPVVVRNKHGVVYEYNDFKKHTPKYLITPYFLRY